MSVAAAHAESWVARTLDRRPAWSPALPVAALLAGSLLLPGSGATWVALTAIIVLGVPHGALDGEIGRDLLLPRFGRLWFGVFSPPYLALAALVLLFWHVAPVATLAGFLAVSVWHFGSEEAANASPFEVVVLGGVPIAAPLLVQPAATTHVFAIVAGTSLGGAPPAWLEVGALAWAALALAWLVSAAAAGRWRACARPALFTAAFAVIPPLTVFAIYFVTVHAPAHTAALIADPVRARRVVDHRSAALRAVPLTVLTILLGASIWPLYGGPLPADHLLQLTLQGLAALTLPHVLLEQAVRAKAETGGALAAAPRPRS